jgi:hypothetical protein
LHAIAGDASGLLNPIVAMRAYMFAAYPIICFGDPMDNMEHDLHEASVMFLQSLYQTAKYLKRDNGGRTASPTTVRRRVSEIARQPLKNYLCKWTAWNRKNMETAFARAITKFETCK